MAEDKEIKCDNINYAVYKIEDWENDYEINIIGTAREKPVTQMEHIRVSVFEIGGKEVNGMIGLGMQLNQSMQKRDLDELIQQEEKEYQSIMEELNAIELKSAEDTISLDTDEYVIYKLEYDGHTLSPKPYNDYAIRHQKEEIERLKKESGQKFVLDI